MPLENLPLESTAPKLPNPNAPIAPDGSQPSSASMPARTMVPPQPPSPAQPVPSSSPVPPPSPPAPTPKPPPPPPRPKPVPPPAPSRMARHVSKEHHSTGPTVGIVIIVMLLLVGAFYFWGEQLNREARNAPAYIPGEIRPQ